MLNPTFSTFFVLNEEKCCSECKIPPASERASIQVLVWICPLFRELSRGGLLYSCRKCLIEGAACWLNVQSISSFLTLLLRLYGDDKGKLGGGGNKGKLGLGGKLKLCADTSECYLSGFPGEPDWLSQLAGGQWTFRL